VWLSVKEVAPGLVAYMPVTYLNSEPSWLYLYQIPKDLAPSALPEPHLHLALPSWFVVSDVWFLPSPLGDTLLVMGMQGVYRFSISSDAATRK